MRVNHRAGSPGEVRIYWRANGLGQGASARRSKVKFDSIPVNPTKYDLIRPKIFVFMKGIHYAFALHWRDALPITKAPCPEMALC